MIRKFGKNFQKNDQILVEFTLEKKYKSKVISNNCFFVENATKFVRKLKH
jgi:hypothetical protein